MEGYLLGRIIGRIFMPFVFSYGILWLWMKLKKQPGRPKLVAVIIGGIIIVFMATIGNYSRRF